MDGQDPESTNSQLRFFANVPLCAWNNRLGPMQYLVRCMLSDLPSFRLPVPHLGQDNMVRKYNMPYLWNSNYLEKCGEGLCHIRVVSLEWGSLCSDQHRLINQKQMLLIMVGIDIILCFGKEHVKIAWECTGKLGQENWNFLHLKKI